MRTRYKVVLGVVVFIVGGFGVLLVAALVYSAANPVATDVVDKAPFTMEMVENAKHIPYDVSWQELSRYHEQHEGMFVVFDGVVAEVTIGDSTAIENHLFGTYGYGFPNSIHISRAQLYDGGALLVGDRVTVYGWVYDEYYGDPWIIAEFIHLGGHSPASLDMVADYLLTFR